MEKAMGISTGLPVNRNPVPDGPQGTGSWEVLWLALAVLETELQQLDQTLANRKAIESRRTNIFCLVTQMRFLLNLGPYTRVSTIQSPVSQKADRAGAQGGQESRG